MTESFTAELPHGRLRLEVEVRHGRATDYIAFAARANAKRAFLFLSMVLGKHYPVRPSRMKAIHDHLAGDIPVQEGPVIFIGMAETATGLGQGVFEAWRAKHPEASAMYLHTTRYRVPGTEALVFEESHSHAPNVFLILPEEPDLRRLFEQAKSVILVDDELSTGTTFVHLVDVLRVHMPDLSKVHLVTISDFMGERRKALPNGMGIPCTVHALLTGTWDYTGENSALLNGRLAQSPPGREASIEDSGYGRLGRTQAVQAPVRLAEVLSSRIGNQKALLLGTGEFMHAAFVLGRVLEDLGCDVHVQATTRSPILEWGAVTEVRHVPDAYGEGLSNYLYNVPPGLYEHVLICHESGASAAHEVAEALGGSLITFARGDHAEESPVR